MALAVVGVFNVVTAVFATIAVDVLLLRLWRPGRRSPTDAGRPRAVSAAAVAALAVIAVATAWNLAHPSEHLLTDRDPGVYVTTGRWVARHGNLVVDAREGPYRHARGVTFLELGYYDKGAHGTLVPQFFHALPVLLADSFFVAGTHGMFWLPPLLGGAALLAFYAFATRLVRPWLAVAATAALAGNLVFVHFARDAYTEVPALLFLFSGLWLLWAAWDRLSVGAAVGAGVFVGAACMTRIDALFVLIPLVAWAALEDRTGSRRQRELVPRVLVGAGVTTGLGLVDVVVRSRPYVYDLGFELGVTAAGVAAILVVWWLAAWRPQRTRELAGRFAMRRELLAWLVPTGVVVFMAVCLLVRPAVQHTHTGLPNALVAALQRMERVKVAPTRTYAEESVRWLTWYLGLGAVALGVAGWALELRDALRQGHDRSRGRLCFLLVFSAITLLYVWKPSISPDQMWAMRRFLTIVIPGLVLLALVVVDRLFQLARPPATVLALLATAVIVVVPLARTAPVRAERTQAGMRTEIARACHAIGPKAAVLVLPGLSEEAYLPATLRSFCGVPTAGASPALAAADVARLAGEWRADGRRLVVVGADGARVRRLAGAAQPPADLTYVPRGGLELTLRRRPSHLVDDPPFRLFVAPVSVL